MSINEIIKRDFSTRPFQLSKIADAIFKAMQAVNQGSEAEAKSVSEKVNAAPCIEQAQSPQSQVSPAQEVCDHRPRQHETKKIKA